MSHEVCLVANALRLPRPWRHNSPGQCWSHSNIKPPLGHSHLRTAAWDVRIESKAWVCEPTHVRCTRKANECRMTSEG